MNTYLLMNGMVGLEAFFKPQPESGRNCELCFTKTFYFKPFQLEFKGLHLYRRFGIEGVENSTPSQGFPVSS